MWLGVTSKQRTVSENLFVFWLNPVLVSENVRCVTAGVTGWSDWLIRASVVDDTSANYLQWNPTFIWCRTKDFSFTLLVSRTSTRPKRTSWESSNDSVNAQSPTKQHVWPLFVNASSTMGGGISKSKHLLTEYLPSKYGALCRKKEEISLVLVNTSFHYFLLSLLRILCCTLVGDGWTRPQLSMRIEFVAVSRKILANLTRIYQV